DLAAVEVNDDVALTVFTAFARTAAAWPSCAVLLCGPAKALEATLHRTVAQHLLPAYPDRAEALQAAALLPASFRVDQRLCPRPSAVVDARQKIGRASCRERG